MDWKYSSRCTIQGIDVIYEEQRILEFKQLYLNRIETLLNLILHETQQTTYKTLQLQIIIIFIIMIHYWNLNIKLYFVKQIFDLYFNEIDVLKRHNIIYTILQIYNFSFTYSSWKLVNVRIYCIMVSCFYCKYLNLTHTMAIVVSIQLL